MRRKSISSFSRTFQGTIILTTGNLIVTSFDDLTYAFENFTLPFHDGGLYHIETSPLTCKANQWTGFYKIEASIMKGLKLT